MQDINYDTIPIYSSEGITDLLEQFSGMNFPSHNDYDDIDDNDQVDKTEFMIDSFCPSSSSTIVSFAATDLGKLKYPLPSVPSQYHISKWKEYPLFWEYTAPQHDENNNANLDWLAVKYCRVSGTGCGYVIGHGFKTDGKDKPLSDCALEFCGIVKKQFDEATLKRMNHGTINEEVARKRYEKENDVTVTEYGFVVPKWNYNIGISPDGCVDQPDANGIYGNIEIKCPQKMYYPYLKYMQNPQRDPLDYSHIWKSHFDQMQWGMGIMNRGWCDYIVLDTFQNIYYQQRVYFNEQYFDYMYLKVVDFIAKYFTPLTNKSQFPLMPPDSI